MSYQLYRNTTVGNTLQESLDELIQVGFVYIALAHFLQSYNLCKKLSCEINNLHVFLVWTDNAGSSCKSFVTIRQIHQPSSFKQSEVKANFQSRKTEYLQVNIKIYFMYLFTYG